MKHLLIALLFLSKPNERTNYDFPNLVHAKAPHGLKQSFNSSVTIHSLTERGTGLGSGNLISFDGELYVFTAAHVVNGSLFLMVSEKGGESFEAEIVAVDPNNDFAILKPQRQPKSTIPAEYKFKFDNLIGKEVYHCGHPSVVSYNVSRGMITGYDAGSYLIDAIALPGSSGGVVFGKKGDIIGVVVSVGIVNALGPPELVEEIVRVAPIDYLYVKALLGEQDGVE